MWSFGKNKKAADSKAEARPRVPTVKFDQSRVTAAVEADILSTLQGVPEISADKLRPAYEAALRSLRAGRALHILHDALTGLGLGKSRASEIPLLIANRATSLMNREQQVSLGIAEAVWLYSGAPCMPNGGMPSPEDRKRNAAHLAANGKRFPIAKGMLMGGRLVWPGQEPGCKCVSKSVIPGFS
jgi:hypothetical protein